MSTSKIEVLRGPGGIKIELDPSQICPSDPGSGTPCLVVLGKLSSTFWYVLDTGCVDDVCLSPDQCKWIDSCEVIVQTWLSVNGGG